MNIMKQLLNGALALALAIIAYCSLNGSAPAFNFHAHKAEAEFSIHVQDALKNNAKFPIDKKLKAIQSAQAAAPDIVFTIGELEAFEQQLKENFIRLGKSLTTSSLASLTIQDYFAYARRTQPQFLAAIRTKAPHFSADDYRTFVIKVNEQKAMLGDRFNERAFAASYLNKIVKEKNRQAIFSQALGTAAAGSAQAAPQLLQHQSNAQKAQLFERALKANLARSKKNTLAETARFKRQFAATRQARPVSHAVEAKSTAELAPKEEPCYGGSDFVSRFAQKYASKELLSFQQLSVQRDKAYDALREKREAALAKQAAEAKAASDESDSETSEDSDIDEQPPVKKLKTNAAAAVQIMKKGTDKPKSNPEKQAALSAAAANSATLTPKQKTINHKKEVFCCSLCDYKTPVRSNAERHFIEKHIQGSHSVKTTCKTCLSKEPKTLRDHLKPHNSQHISIAFSKN